MACWLLFVLVSQSTGQVLTSCIFIWRLNKEESTPKIIQVVGRICILCYCVTVGFSFLLVVGCSLLLGVHSSLSWGMAQTSTYFIKHARRVSGSSGLR